MRLASTAWPNFPDNLLATATHDHKRGEDTRARLAVLSERSAWYAEQVPLWRTLARPLRDDDQVPTAGDELILYQAILGSWPLDLRSDDQAALENYAQTGLAVATESLARSQVAKQLERAERGL